MKPGLAAHRVYFFVVLWFTLWVGFFGTFRPEEILRALPWPVPPLHARFIGAFYLSATVFLLLSLFAKSSPTSSSRSLRLGWPGRVRRLRGPLPGSSPSRGSSPGYACRAACSSPSPPPASLRRSGS